VLRWFLDAARMSCLARDYAIASSTAYDYRDEAIAGLAGPQTQPARGAAGRQGCRSHPM
jgi:hypothetical protein